MYKGRLFFSSVVITAVFALVNIASCSTDESTVIRFCHTLDSLTERLNDKTIDLHEVTQELAYFESLPLDSVQLTEHDKQMLKASLIDFASALGNHLSQDIDTTDANEGKSALYAHISEAIDRASTFSDLIHFLDND